jgi:DNA-binding XRE family transcriptional regulator
MDRVGEKLIYKNLGETVRKLRKIARMKQQELADRVHLSRVSIVNIEKGRHHPQLHVLYDLAAALGCKPSDLLLPINIHNDKLPPALNSKLRSSEKSAVAQLFYKEDKGETP